MKRRWGIRHIRYYWHLLRLKRRGEVWGPSGYVRWVYLGEIERLIAIWRGRA